MNTINTEFATNLGKEFATQLNDTPNDAQNWRFLGHNDDVPDGDHCEMRDHYNYYDLEQKQIDEIERAYKAGFNSVFVPLNGDEE